MSERRASRTLLPILGSLLALWASACSVGNETPPVARMTTSDGDVWAWTADVAGTVEPACDAVVVRGGRRAVTVPVTDGRFDTDLALAAGRNRITAACPDGERSRPVELRVGLRDVPRAQFTPTVSGRTVVLDAGATEASAGSGAPVVEYAWRARGGNPAKLDVPASGERIEVRAPSRDGEYYVTLTAFDESGATDTTANYFVVENGKPAVPDYDTAKPEWVRHAVGYGVLPLLFGSPPFKAVTRRLDYLQELGVNLLWLPPVMATAIGEEYAITDYFGIKEEFGTKEDLRRLITEAHRRGMRVILDDVPNHSSIEHPYFVDRLKRGERSRYWGFYERELPKDPLYPAAYAYVKKGDYTHLFYYDHLPNLNYSNPEVRTYITESMAYWVREFDVDGFRVDAAWAIRDRWPDFWPEWRREMKRVKPDLLLLAEAPARDPYYVTHGFDAAYDWTDDVGQWAWVDAWKPEGQIAQSLVWAITNDVGGGYHRNSLTMRFLNNNDSEVRFVANWGEDITRLAATVQFTVHGLPMLHTADELGEIFNPYTDTTALAWKDRVGLLPYYKRLIELRRTLPSLQAGTWEPFEREMFEDLVEQNVFAFVRSAPGHAPVVVVLNPHRRAKDVRIQLPARYAALAATGSLHDMLSDATVPASGTTLTIPMEAYGSRILVSTGQETR
jgi:cyclomaltodextrinase